MRSRINKRYGGNEIQILDSYEQYRGYVFRIAYRMLGSSADAEDIVHEVFEKIFKQDLNRISNIKSYLAKATINHSINLLQSSSRQREQYIGPWLPEPILTAMDEQPEAKMEQEENIRYALLVMLQLLTPVERAALILKEILGFDYREIAQTLERKESNCRKIISRAKKKLEERRQYPLAETEKMDKKMKAYAELFIKAIQTGNFEALLQQMTDEVTLYTDGGGKTRAAIKPIYGRERVAAFMQGLFRKGRYDGNTYMVELNGAPGILLERKRRINASAIIQVNPKTAEIEFVYWVLNPDKLRNLNRMGSLMTQSE